MPKTDGAPARALTPEQVEALAATAPPVLRTAIALGLGAGLRQGEACGLQLGSVDFPEEDTERRASARHAGQGAPRSSVQGQ